jgi:hypothetical protein
VYLQNPTTDVKGWRAAYFWSMEGNIEMSLVSQNTASCTGDKDGDGESIAYDNYPGITGFQNVAAPVTAAATDASSGYSSVTVQGALVGATTSWIGDWMQVVQGSGLGQARKITAIASAVENGAVTTILTVTPALDVLPDDTSLVAVGRLYWQTYTIGNSINNSSPPCSPSGLTPLKQSAGEISLYAQMGDSATEGNTLTDTGGILLWHTFQQVDPGAQVSAPQSALQTSNEVRANVIDGAFSYGAAATSGITLSYSATPDTAPPPVLGFGIAISHNSITAAGDRFGAVALSPGWYVGPQSANLSTSAWKVADSTLIFLNSLNNVGMSGSNSVGIGQSANWSSQDAPIEWRSVMYGNVCSGRRPISPLLDNGMSTVRYCPTVSADSCECTAQSNGLDMTVQPSAPAADGVSIYAIVVSNKGTNAVPRAVFSAEAPTGVYVKSVTSSSSAVSCDFTDSSVNICQLNTVPPGSSIDLVVSVTTAGPNSSLQPTFSITPQAQ